MSRSRSLLVDLLAAALVPADANADRLVLDRAHVRADARRPLAGRAHHHHVRDGQRRRRLDAAARDDLRAAHPARVLDRARPLMADDHVDVLDEDAPVLRVGLDDAALLAAVLALHHLDGVALADFQRLRHYSTSGASETIFMKFFSRSSRATGPKMRVPRGFRWLSMITAAFSSNAIDVPSFRPNGFFVRTTTARTTSPFLTAPCGVAVLTVPTMMSPTRA